MAKRRVRRPTEDAALAHVMRERKKKGDFISDEARRMRAILAHSHNLTLIAQATTFFERREKNLE